MDEISTALEEAPFVDAGIFGDLLHPRFIGMRRDPSDLNATALEMDEEQHIERDESLECKHLHGKEVGPCEHGLVGTDELFPVPRARVRLGGNQGNVGVWSHRICVRQACATNPELCLAWRSSLRLQAPCARADD